MTAKLFLADLDEALVVWALSYIMALRYCDKIPYKKYFVFDKKLLITVF